MFLPRSSSPWTDMKNLCSIILKFHITLTWSSFKNGTSGKWPSTPMPHWHVVDILKKSVIIYAKDSLTYSPNHAKQTQHVKQVLSCLFDHQLYVKGEKCECEHTCASGISEVHHWARRGVHRLSTVSKWPFLNTVNRLQHFLAFTIFYQCFIQGFSIIALLMANLMKKERQQL